MGFYSWFTADTEESISNSYSIRGALPVKMLDNKSNAWVEKEYAGYGRFGGKGFYELVVKAKTGDVNAAMQLKGIFNNTPKLVIDSLLPFYNAYIKQVEKEGEHLPDKVQLGRVAKAKEIFLQFFYHKNILVEDNFYY